MQSRILCSTGAFIGRCNERNYRLIEEYAPKIHCDGFEFMMYQAWYENGGKVTKELKKTGLSFPVFHADKRIGEAISRNENNDIKQAYEQFQYNCEMASQIGVEKMVIHLWGGSWSDKHMDINIRCFEKLNRISEKYNLLLTVENVVCNQENPMKHWQTLLQEYPDITFTFDTKMAAFHKQLEEIYELENENLWNESHIRHLHINDYAGGYMDWGNLKALNIGKGHIDFKRFFGFLKKMEYRGDYTLEATSLNLDGTVDFECMNNSLDHVREWILAK